MAKIIGPRLECQTQKADDRATQIAQEALKLDRKFSAKGFVNAGLNYKDRAKSERALTTLLQLGLPE